MVAEGFFRGLLGFTKADSYSLLITGRAFLVPPKLRSARQTRLSAEPANRFKSVDTGWRQQMFKVRGEPCQLDVANPCRLSVMTPAPAVLIPLEIGDFLKLFGTSLLLTRQNL